MPYKDKFPIATLVSLILILMTVHNPDVAESVASILFPFVWPLFFLAGFAAIGVFIYRFTQLNKVPQQVNVTEPYRHYSRRLQEQDKTL